MRLPAGCYLPPCKIQVLDQDAAHAIIISDIADVANAIMRPDSKCCGMGAIDVGGVVDSKLEPVVGRLILEVPAVHADTDDCPRTALVHILCLVERTMQIEAEKFGQKRACPGHVGAFDSAVRQCVILNQRCHHILLNRETGRPWRAAHHS